MYIFLTLVSQYLIEVRYDDSLSRALVDKPSVDDVLFPASVAAKTVWQIKSIVKANDRYILLNNQ